MAKRKITDLTEIPEVSGDDFLEIVDVSDTSQSPQGSSRKVKVSDLQGETNQNNLYKEKFLGYYVNGTTLNALFNQELVVEEDELFMIVLGQIDPDGNIIIERYKWGGGKGTFNPIPRVIGTDLIFESATLPNGGDIVTIVEGANTQTFDLGDIGSDTLSDYVNGNGTYDMTDANNVYLFLYEIDGVTYLSRFIGSLGIYGVGEEQTVDADFLGVTNSDSNPTVSPSTDTLADVTGRGNVSEVPLIVEIFGSQAEFGCDEDAGFPYIESGESGGRIIFQQANSGRFRRTYTTEEDANEITLSSKNDDFTALQNQFYRIGGTLEITNPTETEGFYLFKVESGTTTVGSETFTAGDFVLMAYKSGAWQSTILNAPSSGSDDLNDVTARGNVSEVPLIVETFGSQAEFGCDEDAGFPYIENKDTEGRIIFQQANSGSFRRSYTAEEDATELILAQKSEDFTAILYQFYLITETLEITNPSDNLGYYLFKVDNGTTTVGSETFTAGDFVLMAYKDSAWRSTILNGASSGATWGSITGTLSAQTDLQTALNGKENTITAGTTGQYYRGDKTFQTLDKTAVGLSNVDNTSDANKPISTATQTALNARVRFLANKTAGSHTGSTTETVLNSLEIPANTLTGNDWFTWLAQLTKDTTATNTYRLWINTTNSLSGATQIAFYTSAAANRNMPFGREFFIKSGNLIGTTSTSNNMLTTIGVLSNQDGLSIAFNHTQTYYFLVTATNTDTTTVSTCQAQKISIL